MTGHGHRPRLRLMDTRRAWKQKNPGEKRSISCQSVVNILQRGVGVRLDAPSRHPCPATEGIIGPILVSRRVRMGSSRPGGPARQYDSYTRLPEAPCRIPCQSPFMNAVYASKGMCDRTIGRGSFAPHLPITTHEKFGLQNAPCSYSPRG
ncbi:hypothetical protein LZ31DRAFT_35728 [Colletotrichum somersetense]|nr:hypothetical protein LZ31DRAFT_35728 [Colletotrichum somersetense]